MYILRVFITVMNPIKPPLMNKRWVKSLQRIKFSTGCFYWDRLIETIITVEPKYEDWFSVRLCNFLHKLFWKYMWIYRQFLNNNMSIYGLNGKSLRVDLLNINLYILQIKEVKGYVEGRTYFLNIQIVQ